MVGLGRVGWVVGFWLNLGISLKASRTLSKIDDSFRFFAAVDDDFDIPEWGWCP